MAARASELVTSKLFGINTPRRCMASDRWDDLLSDSTWYVPAANLLAYRFDSTSPDAPIPAADQTIWSIGEATGGRFTGKSLAKIVDANGDVTQSLSTMDGVVTERGQVRITFTTPIGSTITGTSPASLSSAGISAMHGAHQVAHRLTSIFMPL